MPDANKMLPEVRRGDSVSADLFNDLTRQVNGNAAVIGSEIAIGDRRGPVDNDVKIIQPSQLMVKNNTGAAIDSLRPVLGYGSSLKSPVDNDERALELPFVNGADPSAATSGKFVVAYGRMEVGDFREAVASGLTWVRVLVNSESHKYADIESGNSTRLQTATSGSAHIIELKASEGGGGDDERWALVRLSNPTSSLSSGGGSTGIINLTDCCYNGYIVGSIDFAGYKWANKYTLYIDLPGTADQTLTTGAAEVIFDGESEGTATWKSADIDWVCEAGTDVYEITMTATSTDPHAVIVTVAMTSGGAYGGTSACCPTTPTGIAQKFESFYRFAPLRGAALRRHPDEDGTECEVGSCVICVLPGGVNNSDKQTSPCYDPANLMAEDEDIYVPKDWAITVTGGAGRWGDNTTPPAFCQLDGYDPNEYLYAHIVPTVQPDPGATEPCMLEKQGGQNGFDINGTYFSGTGAGADWTPGSCTVSNGDSVSAASVCSYWTGANDPTSDGAMSIAHGEVWLGLYCDTFLVLSERYVRYVILASYAVGTADAVGVYAAEKTWHEDNFTKQAAEEWVAASHSLTRCSSTLPAVRSDDFAWPTISIGPVV